MNECMKYKLRMQKGYQVKIDTVFTLEEAKNKFAPLRDVAICNTLQYIYSKTEGGAIFFCPKLNKFVALINIKYKNTWHKEMQVTAEDIKLYIKEKEKAFACRKAPYVKLKPISKWTNNGCLINMYDFHQLFNSYTYEIIDMFREMTKTNIKTKINLTKPFIIWLKDFPLLPITTPGPFIPIFSQSTCPNYADIAIPNNEEWAMITKKYYPTKCKFDDIDAIMNVSWENKIEKAFFRGSGTGCFSDDRNPRFHVSRLSKLHPDLLDAGITRCVQRDKMEDDIIVQTHPTGLDFNLSPEVPMPEFGRYKYILNIKGNGAAYRLPYLFFLGSVVLIVQTKFSLWFEPALVPWKHYIPIREDLSNLTDVVVWCRANDAKARKIALQGQEFAKEWFTRNNITFYMSSLVKSLGLCAK